MGEAGNVNVMDFKVINEPLEELLGLIVDDLKSFQNDRFPSGFPFVIRVLVTIAWNTYKAIRVLVTKDVRFVGEAKVLCRSLLDEVFTVFLLCAKPSKYTALYLRSGWRESSEYYQISEKDTGSDKEWLGEFQEYLNRSAKSSGVSDKEMKNPNALSYWPTPPQMLKYEFKKDFEAACVPFLELLNRLFYTELSQVMHSSERGLHTRIYPIWFNLPEEQTGILMSEPVCIAQLFLLIILTEVNRTMNFAYSNQLMEVWTYLSETVPLYKDLYVQYPKSCLRRMEDYGFK